MCDSLGRTDVKLIVVGYNADSKHHICQMENGVLMPTDLTSNYGDDTEPESLIGKELEFEYMVPTTCYADGLKGGLT